MKRIVIAPLVLALLATACGGSGDEEAAGGEVLRADVPRATVAPAAVEPAVASVNRVGTDLYRRLAAETGNIVLSPTSIATALAMARAGAAGLTATEMDSVLAVTDPAALHAGMNALDQALAARSGPQPQDDGTTVEVTLTSANSLWAQTDRTYEQLFLDLLASQYGAGLRTVDYERDPEAARAAINGWVAEETRDRIPELLPEGSVQPETRLTLVNAVYLKAPWRYAFAEGGTQPGPFTKTDGTTVQVPLMALDERLPYARGAGWQAVELPYAGGDLAMLVLVPDAGELTAFEQALTADQLAQIAGSLQATQVALRLPKWDTERELSLRDALAALGMPTAFTDAADFSGMTTEEPLQIADVIHQANITVDEKGTEAAAATAVVMEATAAAPQPVELTVDRPFVFALRDTATGAVLFLGRVTDPSA